MRHVLYTIPPLVLTDETPEASYGLPVLTTETGAVIYADDDVSLSGDHTRGGDIAHRERRERDLPDHIGQALVAYASFCTRLGIADPDRTRGRQRIVANSLRLLIAQLDLTQKEFGRAVGAREVTVASWVNGRRRPSRRFVPAIRALEASLAAGEKKSSELEKRA